MRFARRLFASVRALLRKDREELELEEELRAFLEADIARRMQSRLNRDDAVRAARAHTGSIEAVKDFTRDAGWESRIEALWQDVRYAVRGLRRSTAFAATAVLTLALGIGANTAIFSVVSGLLLRTLPVPSPGQLMLLSTRGDVDAGYPSGWNYAIWDQIRQRQESLGDAIAWTLMPQRFDLARSGESEHADGLFVSGNFFSTLGVPALLGRTVSLALRIAFASTRVSSIAPLLHSRHSSCSSAGRGRTSRSSSLVGRAHLRRNRLQKSKKCDDVVDVLVGEQDV